MNIHIHTPEEIEKMRTAGRLAAEVLEIIAPHINPGITTEELDDICHHHMVDVQKTIPAPLNYGAAPGRPGFPKSTCISLNQVVCHGIPSPKKILKKGDILNIDVTVIKDGFHGDTSKMFMVGEVQSFNERLARVTRECMYKGIGQIRPGARLSDIGRVIEEHAHAHNYSVVEEYCGHGIGRTFHADPQVLHYNGYGPRNDCTLQEGMIFTVEPMINAGRKETRLLADGWTTVTRDHRPSAQWEHTILVTRDGYEILTLRNGETNPIKE
ncbi:Methionine aminopeptidase [invertebrate metagenome]|uniref:Methionine aminopeptidase n=1 Tax=invertebrate metagenome TaxID=1711999 RepID=A0A2H9TAE1_9ZZZZ